MAVDMPLFRKPFPVFPQSDKKLWDSDSSPHTVITIQARHTSPRPSLSHTNPPEPEFGVSFINSSRYSIPSPRSPSILDKTLPPTPFAEAFGDIALPSPDSDPLLNDSNDDVEVSSDLPSRAVIEEAADLPVQDADGKQIPFKALYMPSNPLEKRRVMVIFIRHFFCGNCQEYLRSLTSSIPSPSALPDGTNLVIVGCGSASLIHMYTEETACPYPVYADPTKRLYDILGMGRTLNLGRNNPEYIRHSLLAGMFKSVIQGVKRLGEGDAFRGGDMRQIGGEFVFEVNDDSSYNYGNETTEMNEPNADVKVTWCHRMRNTRDHAEIRVIRHVLGLGPGTNTEARSFMSEGRWRRPHVRRWTTNLAQAMSHGHKHSWSRSHGLFKGGKSLDAGRTGISAGKPQTNECSCDNRQLPS